MIFWDKLIKLENGCWEWPFACTKGGYGQINVNGKMWRTHRFAWYLVAGPIAPGIMICHRCDNRKCCNPDHLFPGTTRDNNLDMVLKGRGNWFGV